MSEVPAYLTINDDNIVIELKKGVDIDGVTVKSVTMREPTVSDNIAMDTTKGSDAIKEVTYFANLCGVAPDDLKALTFRDYSRLQKAYSFFID